MSTNVDNRALQAPPSGRKGWTTREFDQLVDIGSLPEGGAAYLWNGEIVETMPENPPHINAVANLLLLLLTRFPPVAWTVNQNAPVELGDDTKPQPDLAVLAGPRSRFSTRAARASDVALIVEVSDSTYPRDAGERLRKYASVGISQYWIVNINALRVEVFTGPTGGVAPSYRERNDFGLGDVVPLRLTVGGVAIDLDGCAVSDVLRDSLKHDEEGTGR